MKMDIEEKFARLNPEAQQAVDAFIDFLLSRCEGSFSGAEETGEDSWSSENEQVVGSTDHEKLCSSNTDTGIILAEERMIEEESVIDFADINTRFAKKDTKRAEEEKSRPVRQKKMFDWL